MKLTTARTRISLLVPTRVALRLTPHKTLLHFVGDTSHTRRQVLTPRLRPFSDLLVPHNCGHRALYANKSLSQHIIAAREKKKKYKKYSLSIKPS